MGAYSALAEADPQQQHVGRCLQNGEADDGMNQVAAADDAVKAAEKIQAAM